MVVKIKATNRHNIHAVAIYRQRYRKCRPSSLQSSSKNVSIFDERPKNVSIFDERHEQIFAEITGAKVNRGAGYGGSGSPTCLLSMWT